MIPLGLRISINEFDRHMDSLFGKLRGHMAADRIFYAASELGNHSIIWHMLNLIQLVFTRNTRRSIVFALVLGMESALINGPVKMLFRRERPAHEGERPHPLRKPKTSSFPSGHATSAMCAAALLSQADPKRKPLYYGIGSLVAASRVHVKIHHASDVVAGAAFGSVIGVLAKRVVPKQPKE